MQQTLRQNITDLFWKAEKSMTAQLKPVVHLQKIIEIYDGGRPQDVKNNLPIAWHVKHTFLLSHTTNMTLLLWDGQAVTLTALYIDLDITLW